MTPFDLFLQILDIYPRFKSVKFDANSFIDDRYMATLELRGLATKCLFGQIWEIWPPKIVKLLFWPPKVRTSRGRDTRFEIVRIKMGSAISSVALFKY